MRNIEKASFNYILTLKYEKIGRGGFDGHVRSNGHFEVVSTFNGLHSDDSFHKIHWKSSCAIC